jgi:hypothetical protein
LLHQFRIKTKQKINIKANSAKPVPVKLERPSRSAGIPARKRSSEAENAFVVFTGKYDFKSNAASLVRLSLCLKDWRAGMPALRLKKIEIFRMKVLA